MASHGATSSTRFRKTANYQTPSNAALDDSGSFGHFISIPAVEQRFTLDGVPFDPSDPDQWKRAEELMSKLGNLIRFNPDPLKEDPNRNLPSGYTYFLQIVAHDLVHSAISTSLGQGRTSGLSNVRDVPLRLETVYGGGPTACPHAYEASQAAFRSKLRLGNSRINASDQDHQGPRETSREAPLARSRSLPKKTVMPRH